ncbi:podocin [Megalops cyprinoides]|uniref:podocin n=1 Tax=Megalops cyprinoides TaxID=118141 RepID=UPI0018650CBD|nr:podocin [Megalops cyprinoides]
MEGTARSASPRRSAKEGRGAKRDSSPASKGRRNKASKSGKRPENMGKKEGEKREPEGEAAKAEEPEQGAAKPHSTVVNVDSVRDGDRGEDTEESLGLLEQEWQGEGLKGRTPGVCEWLLTVVALLAVVLSFPLSIWLCLKIVREHERAVILRLGHLLPGKPKGPGLIFYLPFLDVCQKVDIRLKMLKVPSHTVVTKDLVSTELSAVCYYRIENVSLCFTSLSGVSTVLQGLVQASNREVLARHNFTQILLERKKIAQEIQVALDAVTSQWGIKVERAELEDVCIPPELQHSVAAEAQAKRIAQIKVIAAEGEKAACEALKASMDSLSGSPAAVQLRLLQLLHTLRTENPALVLTLPSDLLALPTDLSLSPSPANQTLTGDGTSKESNKDSPML